ncbi:hypothetical protein OBBRIDRAFT_139340 [Obba rivulosa]|uniref:Uncharacterized protein n=1 Tax=Obba rivulosa TaxID=1052685 RepID=A0A8E2AMY5_9APHY|nr:hypothetical protein OBBRIDRAFT_139340 [Obba rivulosa]
MTADRSESGRRRQFKRITTRERRLNAVRNYLNGVVSDMETSDHAYEGPSSASSVLRDTSSRQGDLHNLGTGTSTSATSDEFDTSVPSQPATYLDDVQPITGLGTGDARQGDENETLCGWDEVFSKAGVNRSFVVDPSQPHCTCFNPASSSLRRALGDPPDPPPGFNYHTCTKQEKPLMHPVQSMRRTQPGLHEQHTAPADPEFYIAGPSHFASNVQESSTGRRNIPTEMSSTRRSTNTRGQAAISSPHPNYAQADRQIEHSPVLPPIVPDIGAYDQRTQEGMVTTFVGNVRTQRQLQRLLDHRE